MRSLPIPPQFLATAVAVGLGFFVAGPSAPENPHIVLKSATAIAAAAGEAAPLPVDLDGDGLDDSVVFADALFADGAPPPDAEIDPQHVLVLRLVHLPCAGAAKGQAVADLDAPLKHDSPDTPRLLLAAGDGPIANVKGDHLRVFAGPVLDTSVAHARVLVVEPDRKSKASTRKADALAAACKAPATVS